MCSLCWPPVAKNHNFWQILTFLGAPVPNPFYWLGPNLVSYSRPPVYVYLQNFVSMVYSVVPWLRKTPIFAVFWTSAFSGVAHWQQSEKVEHGAQLQTFPYLAISKSFLYSNAFMAKLGHNLWHSKAWRTDRQTVKQKTERFWLPRWRVKSEPHQTWHGDRGLRARSSTSKTFRGLTHSFAARGRWKFGGNQTPST